MKSDHAEQRFNGPRLPHPGRPVGPDRPFVGNVTADDNLAEAVQIAAWTAIGSAKCAIAFDVHGHTVTMTGQLPTEQQRQALEAAIFRVAGIQIVINKISLHGEPAADPASQGAEQPAGTRTIEVEAQQIVSVTRFCGLDEASLSAAIRGAVALLDRAFALQGLPLARELFVTYQNHRLDTVTVQIGMPSAQFAPAGEFHVGPCPAGRMAVATVEAGPAAVEQIDRALTNAPEGEGRLAAKYCWQRFHETAFRPWVGHPAAEILVPLTAVAAA
jgi:hypothetical protein